MITSGLMICSFYLKKRFSRDDNNLYNLNEQFVTRDEEHKHDNVLDMLISFCQENFEFSDDEKNMKMFSVDSGTIQISDEETYRALSFSIRSGAYGLESNITDRNTKKIKYQRTEDDADIKNFKFLAFVPKDVNNTSVSKGIMIFQTLGTYGVKTITLNYLKRFFAERDLTLETRSVSIRAFIEKLVEYGRMYKITLVKNRVSPDSIDNIFINSGREERSYIKPQLKPAWFEKFLQLIESKSEIYEIEDVCYDDIKIQFKLGDNYRTVGLRHIDKFSVVEDIPDSIYKNGKYEEDALTKYMLDTAIEYKEKMIFNV